MPILVCACHCGSSDSLARNFLKSVGFQDWLSIPIVKGKEKSLALTNELSPSAEKEMLKSFLKDASKWVVIIGHDGVAVRWSDIAHHGVKSKIEAEFIVQNFQS